MLGPRAGSDHCLVPVVVSHPTVVKCDRSSVTTVRPQCDHRLSRNIGVVARLVFLLAR